MKNRKLLVKPDAATEVRRIFSRYLELESVPALVDEMKRSGASRNEAGADLARSSGQPLAPVPSIRTGKFYYLLSNPIYVGKIRHADELYEGNHQPIIEQATFDRAQALLSKQAPRAKGSTVQRDTHLLNGLLFDESGDRLSPIHAKKDGKRYRYYISSRLKGAKRNGTDGWRLPALELENIVVHQLRAILADRVTLARWIGEHASQQDVQKGLAEADLAARSIKNEEPDRLRGFLRTAFRRVTVSQDTIAFKVDDAAIADWTTGRLDLAICGSRVPRRIASQAPVSTDASSTSAISIPISLKRRGIETRLIVENEVAPIRKPDRPLVDAIARAHAYLARLTDGTGRDRLEVAKMFGVHKEDVSRFLPLAFLSPKVVEAILHGRQPADLSVRDLVRTIDLPLSWSEQEKLLSL